MLKKILIALLVLLVIGVAAGFYTWYKPHPEPKNGIEVTAENLAREYDSDETKANEKYLGKSVEVSGIVSSVAKNQDGAVVITLDTGDPMAEILCTMTDKTINMAKGQKITVLGFCKGNNMGVVLTDGVIK